MLKYAALVSLVMAGSAAQAGPFDYDGKFDASQYDRVFGVTYEFDGRNVDGGKLALATVGLDKQYMYFSHPLSFKDFSYGAEADERYRVGWDGQDDGNTSLGKAVDSEFFEFSLTPAGGSALSVKFDLEKPSRQSTINGTGVDAGVPTSIGGGASAGFISTLDYNAKQVSGSFDGSLGAFENHSPETVAPDGGACADETSSDPACYVLKDTLENRLGSAANPIIDWQFEFGIEIELTKAGGGLFFGDLASIDLSDFGYQTGNAMIRLDELHASDPKTISRDKHGQLDCSDGSSPDHEPCTATVTPPPNPVPAPATLILLAIGLLGLGLRRRRT